MQKQQTRSHSFTIWEVIMWGIPLCIVFFICSLILIWFYYKCRDLFRRICKRGIEIRPEGNPIAEELPLNNISNSTLESKANSSEEPRKEVQPRNQSSDSPKHSRSHHQVSGKKQKVKNPLPGKGTKVEEKYSGGKNLRKVKNPLPTRVEATKEIEKEITEYFKNKKSMDK